MNSLQKLLSHTNYKKCKKCGEIKRTNDFYNGFSRCKSCISADRKEKYYADPEKFLNRMKEYEKNNPDKRWTYATLQYHEQRGFKIEMTRDEINTLYNSAISKPCIFCGITMERGNGKSTPCSPTLDVIDPNKKIIKKGNVQVICHECNTSKSSRTNSEFVRYCIKLLENYKKGLIPLSSEEFSDGGQKR